jgi:hypothetical protein
MQIRPNGAAVISRLMLDLCWAAQDGERPAHVKVVVQIRRLLVPARGQVWV